MSKARELKEKFNSMNEALSSKNYKLFKVDGLWTDKKFAKVQTLALSTFENKVVDKLGEVTSKGGKDDIVEITEKGTQGIIDFVFGNNDDDCKGCYSVVVLASEFPVGFAFIQKV